jgi:cytochrome oxidase Cu insertion factor (SCO1/SenC/PrrC family)
MNSGNGNFAPGFTLDDLDGNAVALSQFRGYPVLLDFMSTTNQTCKKNMPGLVELYNNYSKRDAVFLSITFGGESAPVVKSYMQGWKAAWTGLLGTNPVKKDYGIKDLPTYVMIDPKGSIAGSLTGEQSYASLKALIELALA